MQLVYQILIAKRKLQSYQYQIITNQIFLLILAGLKIMILIVISLKYLLKYQTEEILKLIIFQLSYFLIISKLLNLYSI